MAFTGAYLNARARALIGQILPDEAIARVSAQPNPDEALRLLEADGYFRHASRSDGLSRAERLREQLDADFRDALLVLQGRERAVVRALYSRFEAEFIKAALGCAWHGIAQELRPRLPGVERRIPTVNQHDDRPRRITLVSVVRDGTTRQLEKGRRRLHVLRQVLHRQIESHEEPGECCGQ